MSSHSYEYSTKTMDQHSTVTSIRPRPWITTAQLRVFDQDHGSPRHSYEYSTKTMDHHDTVTSIRPNHWSPRHSYEYSNKTMDHHGTVTSIRPRPWVTTTQLRVFDQDHGSPRHSYEYSIKTMDQHSTVTSIRPRPWIPTAQLWVFDQDHGSPRHSNEYSTKSWITKTQLRAFDQDHGSPRHSYEYSTKTIDQQGTGTTSIRPWPWITTAYLIMFHFMNVKWSAHIVHMPIYIYIGERQSLQISSHLAVLDVGYVGKEIWKLKNNCTCYVDWSSKMIA